MRICYAMLLTGGSAAAIASGAHAQTSTEVGSPGAASAALAGRASADDTAEARDIVITGSRVVTNGNAAPTPVTVLSTAKLLETAPTNIPDALNRLPQFSQQASVRNIGAAGSNNTANVLNLRRFGANRNLILLDGSRVPPTTSDGTVDTNLIPQSLVQRVEIVTGGASAVYGSDAVSGVVNFILDHNYNGIKFNSQYGTSSYGDDRNWRVGGAAGTKLFGGRGHIEVSFDHYSSKGILGVDSRPEGVDYPTIGGNGTAGNPFRIIYNGRVLTGSRGGLILSSNLGGTLPVGLRDITFKADGVPSPFVHGAATGVSGLESGGDGAVYNQSTIVAPLKTNQAFGRFDFDVTDHVRVYTQTSYTTSYTDYPYLPVRLTNAILTGNPFIPAAIQAAMTANNITYINVSKFDDGRDGYAPRSVRANTKNLFVKSGLEGDIGTLKWNANYTYSRSTQQVTNVNNNLANVLAASTDAVRDPTGKIVCNVSLTAFANLYPGCEPINLFGPTAATAGAFDYATTDTKYKLTNLLHDVNASVSAQPFSTWAGPVGIALNAEYRYLSLRNVSTVDPGVPPNCTGLRVIGANCTPTTPPAVNNATANAYAKQNVKEVGAEVLIPLLKDVPLVQSFELNLAGRYTNYSTSGGVKTWKIGGTWQVVDGLRIRGTASRDIRAPTLQNLFAPVSSSAVGFSDLHTNIILNNNVFTQGNPNLVPEVARTNTVGIIFQPSFIPRLSIAIDAYEIKINNALTAVSGNNAQVQRECEDSNGLSPYCALFERPLPFSDRSPANFPTKVYSLTLNAAKVSTRGIDAEINYNTDLASVMKALRGRLAVRTLISYQPDRKTQTLTSLPVTDAAGIAGESKLRVNLNLAYALDDLNFSLVERWQSGGFFTDPATNVDARGKIPSYFYTDLSINYTFKVRGHDIAPFLTVENLFNRRPPIAGTTNSVPGLFYPSVAGYDIVGRYFTFGVRGKF